MIDWKNNISDELLAAYLDGNTTPEENAIIEDAITNEEELMEVVDVTKDTISFGGQFDIWDGDYGFWELGIDPVFTREELIAEESEERSVDVESSQENSLIGNIEGNDVESINNDHYMKVYGEERNYSLRFFDENIAQGYTNTCAIRAQEIILRDYGIMIPQEQLMTFAVQNGWYDPGRDPLTILEGGTPLSAVGNLLNVCGINTKIETDCTAIDLAAELRQGHRVIVSVDADELWEKGWLAEQKHKFNDLYERGGNHALIVAGVEVNPKDPGDINIVLTDPGTGHLRISYKWDKFYEAWEDSNCTMISTTVPAPYQFNAENGMMEPSGFSTNFYPSQIQMPSLLQNSFPPLSDEYYATYGHYSSHYSIQNTIPLGSSFASDKPVDTPSSAIDSEGSPSGDMDNDTEEEKEMEAEITSVDEEDDLRDEGLSSSDEDENDNRDDNPDTEADLNEFSEL